MQWQPVHLSAWLCGVHWAMETSPYFLGSFPPLLDGDTSKPHPLRTTTELRQIHSNPCLGRTEGREKGREQNLQTLCWGPPWRGVPAVPPCPSHCQPALQHHQRAPGPRDSHTQCSHA